MATKKIKQKGNMSRFGSWGVIQFADHAYSFEIGASMLLAGISTLPFATRNSWERIPLQIGPFKIIPNGATNDLPYELRDLLEDNNLTEGILSRKRGLTWGQGPQLFRREIIDGTVKRTWVSEPEIENWLKSWDYEEYLRKTIVDYNHMEGHFTRYYRNLGARIAGGKQFIAKIENVGYHRARLEWPEDGLNWKNIIEGDWYNPNLYGLTIYPKFDRTRPFAYPVSMSYSNMNSFCRDFYGLPVFWGALPWIRQGSSIPKILEALTKNSLNIKWHIKSPTSYWDAQRDKLQTVCQATGEVYKEEMLEELKDEFFKELANVLSGVDNTGKFFTSETSFNINGSEEGFSIEPIDQKTKDFITSQIEVAKHAETAITGGMGLHPSLANLMIDGKLSSGSEMMNAIKNYMATEIDIPERIICQAINWAIDANWPGRGLQLGFYHDAILSESQISPQDRMNTNVQQG